MNGVISINKPSKLTSYQVVTKVKHSLKIPKAGHFGTLDPLATGLLLVGIGKATKLFPFISKKDKTYQGQMKLGITTDTYDSRGSTVSENRINSFTLPKLEEAMREFEGEINQLPPPFSAKKYKGRPVYKLARNNQKVDLKPCRVRIHYFRKLLYNPPLVRFEVKCSAGTYIRSLVHDLGQYLGCGAHLSELTRTQSGNFQLKDSFSLEEIDEYCKEGRIEKFLIPLENLLTEYPKIIVNTQGSTLIKNGIKISREQASELFVNTQDESFEKNQHKDNIFRIFNTQGKLLALARKIDQKFLHPFLVFIPRDRR